MENNLDYAANNLEVIKSGIHDYASFAGIVCDHTFDELVEKAQDAVQEIIDYIRRG